MRRLFLLTWALLWAGSACAAPLTVFVSLLPHKYFVERVGGARVKVHALVGSGRDPHSFEPTPRQMTQLAAAAVYFRSGVNFENAWMRRLQASNRTMKMVDLRQGVTLLKPPAPVLASGHADHHHADDEADVHTWTDPARVKVQAATIRDTLAALDPAGREFYAANHASFVRELEALDAGLRQRLAPYRGRAFLTFHPAWGYFADAYGLRQLAIEAGGKEPGPRTLATLIQTAKKENIHAVLVQPQFSRRTAESVARGLGARLVTVDNLAEDWPANLRRVGEAFAGALQ